MVSRLKMEGSSSCKFPSWFCDGLKLFPEVVYFKRTSNSAFHFSVKFPFESKNDGHSCTEIRINSGTTNRFSVDSHQRQHQQFSSILKKVASVPSFDVTATTIATSYRSSLPSYNFFSHDTTQPQSTYHRTSPIIQFLPY